MLTKRDANWTSGTYVAFYDRGVMKGRKTSVYDVYPYSGDKVEPGPLGWIKWFGRWRKYSFFPATDAVFEETCLRDIADFCVQVTKEYRTSK